MMSRSLLFYGYSIGTQELRSIDATLFHSAWCTKEIPGNTIYTMHYIKQMFLLIN